MCSSTSARSRSGLLRISVWGSFRPLYQDPVGELVQDLCFRISVWGLCGPLVSGSCRSTCTRSLLWGHLCKISVSGLLDHLYQGPVRPLLQDLCMRILLTDLYQDPFQPLVQDLSLYEDPFGPLVSESCSRTCARSLLQAPFDCLYLSVQDFLWTACIILEEHLRKISISRSFRKKLGWRSFEKNRATLYCWSFSDSPTSQLCLIACVIGLIDHWWWPCRSAQRWTNLCTWLVLPISLRLLWSVSDLLDCWWLLCRSAHCLSNFCNSFVLGEEICIIFASLRVGLKELPKVTFFLELVFGSFGARFLLYWVANWDSVARCVVVLYSFLFCSSICSSGDCDSPVARASRGKKNPSAVSSAVVLFPIY